MKRKHKFFSGRSMFLKYMNMSVIIVFLSFLILGIILTMTISQYWYNEKHSTLTARADNIAEYLRMNVKGGGVHGEARILSSLITMPMLLWLCRIILV